MRQTQLTAKAANDPISRVYLRTGTRVYHHWGLSDPTGKKGECIIYTVNEEPPGHEDVLGFCGNEYYQIWLEEPVCEEGQEEDDECTGLFLHDYGEIDDKLKSTIWLPLAEVSIEITGCEPWNGCGEPPRLSVVGFEPLRNYRIDSVHIEYPNQAGQVCWRTENCESELPLTSLDGADVVIYANSSYGDKSATSTFRLRLVALPDYGYLFQVLNSEWDYLAPPESVAWGIFPDLSDSAAPWILRTNNVQDLSTFHDYTLLAGRLILRGDVDVGGCIYGGLTAEGGASQCGMELARPIVYEYQNKYDQAILLAAQRTRIPPRIIKGVIAQESQFWSEWYLEGEYGLGMITDDGIDMMLTWNPVAFLDMCIPIHGLDKCAWGYANLDDYSQSYLRGIALDAVGTEGEISRIAQTIVGAAAQTGQIIKNVTRKEPYELLTYEDMWELSLGVYNSGAGCMFYAIREAWTEHDSLSWAQISEYLIGDCQGAADYSNNVLFFGVP